MDDGIETIERLLMLGMGLLFSPKWEGLFNLETQKFDETTHNFAIGTANGVRTSVVAKIGRLAIKDISKKLYYLLWTQCGVRVHI